MITVCDYLDSWSCNTRELFLGQTGHPAILNGKKVKTSTLAKVVMGLQED
jgi:hypothetical protein